MRVSVHLKSTNGMHISENTERFFCLRSKRSVVRIHSGVPLSHRLNGHPAQKLMCSCVAEFHWTGPSAPFSASPPCSVNIRSSASTAPRTPSGISRV